MQTVLEQGSIDKPLTFDVGLIQLSFIPVCSLNTCNISVKLCRGFALQCFSFCARGLQYLSCLSVCVCVVLCVCVCVCVCVFPILAPRAIRRTNSSISDFSAIRA